jgi:hypothetical protein
MVSAAYCINARSTLMPISSTNCLLASTRRALMIFSASPRLADVSSFSDSKASSSLTSKRPPHLANFSEILQALKLYGFVFGAVAVPFSVVGVHGVKCFIGQAKVQLAVGGILV